MKQGRLRVGLAENTILIALAHAIVLTPPYTPEGEEKVVDMTAKKSLSKLAIELEESENLIRQVYSECPDFDLIVPTLLTKPLSELHSVCHLLPGKSCCFLLYSLGIPVVPMLAKPTKGISEVLNRFQNVDFTCEYKYDGERAQVCHSCYG